MLLADFDYSLPKELIAQQPLARRDASRMLVLERETGKVHDAMFNDIGTWLRKGDLLVLNNTRVIPARVFGRLPTGGTLELLLLRQLEPGVWEALARPSRKARPGTMVKFGGPDEIRSQKADTRSQNSDSPQHSAEGRVPGSYTATIVERKPEGMHVVRFEPPDISELQQAQGEIALPPYIKEKCGDYGRYQTVFAQVDGAIAAPTAGLHFTPELLGALRQAGIETAIVTLHAGLGTFRPVKADKVEEHVMHPEEFELPAVAAEQVNHALAEGRRVVCVGTTTVRVLEGQADEARSQSTEARMQNPEGGRDNRQEAAEVGSPESPVSSVQCPVSCRPWRVRAGKGQTNLYIYPGYQWKVVGALLTNFHVPKSTLLMLVSAFAGRDKVLAAYRRAIEQRYRFYSFGDAMLVV
jgi:S-adenosylmethionine:tRNA ribosyltransferase-isomerase